MAVIHKTTLTPTKVELLTSWLPGRPWYRGSGTPELERTGGFRLDDPAGEVGIEFMVVTDRSTPESTAYLVPLTYRDAPLAGAEDGLIGTTEHGVLGKRWVYDGCHDPVLTTELLALIGGTAQAMAQSITDTPDHEVTRSHTGDPLPRAPHAPAPVDDAEGTALPAPRDTVLRVHRVLRPAPGAEMPGRPEDAVGHVATGWPGPDGTRMRGVFMELRTA